MSVFMIAVYVACVSGSIFMLAAYAACISALIELVIVALTIFDIWHSHCREKEFWKREEGKSRT